MRCDNHSTLSTTSFARLSSSKTFCDCLQLESRISQRKSSFFSQINVIKHTNLITPSLMHIRVSNAAQIFHFMINRECLWTAKWKWFVFVPRMKREEKVIRNANKAIVGGEWQQLLLSLCESSVVHCKFYEVSESTHFLLICVSRFCKQMSKEVCWTMSESAWRRAFNKRKFKFYDKRETTEKNFRILRNLLSSSNLLKLI